MAFYDVLKSIRFFSLKGSGVVLLVFVFTMGERLFADTPAAEILSSSTTVELKGHRLIKNYAYSIQINNREGDEFGQISISWSSMEKVSKITGRIEDKLGRVVKKLKKDDLSLQSNLSDGAFFEDSYAYVFSLKHFSYPYTIHYAYQEEKTEFMYVAYWYPCEDTEIPTHNARLQVTVPAHYKFKIKQRGIADAEVTRQKSGEICYTWEGNYLDQVKKEKNAPNMNDILPMVVLIPETFVFDVPGSFSSWQTYGSWESKLKEGMDVLPYSEQQTITRLLDGISDTLEQVKVLYHYLQDHTRYINVSLETGGMKPFPATYVAEKKYGDCKALGNYFSTLLKYAGITAYYCNVEAGNVISPIDTAYPSMQFNHIISCIPLANDTLWVDCTSKMAFNYLGTFTQNRKAFLIDKSRSAFAHTPALQPNDVHTTRFIRIHVDEAGFTKVHAQNRYRGFAYEQLFYLNSEYATDAKDKVVRDAFIPNGYRMEDYALESEHRDSTFMHLRYTAVSEAPFDQYGSEMLIKMLPFPLTRYEKPGERTLPVQLNYPTCLTDTLVYRLPANFSLQTVPENFALKSEFGAYSITFRAEENGVHIVKKLTLNNGFIPVDKYEEFYTFYQHIYAFENTSYMLTGVTQTND